MATPQIGRLWTGGYATERRRSRVKPGDDGEWADYYPIWTTKTNIRDNYIKDNIPNRNREMLKQVQHDRGEAYHGAKEGSMGKYATG
jgi:hypothetical protein